METTTLWMYTDEEGNLSISPNAPQDGNLYIAVTPDFLNNMQIDICEAPTAGANNHNNYYVRRNITALYAGGQDNTGLAMMVFIASHNSVDDEDALIHFGPEANRVTKQLKTISDYGFERAIGKGDIVANKACFIRYNPITDSVILLNPSMDKEAYVTNLHVYNTARFYNQPQVRKEVTVAGGVKDFKYVDILDKDHYDALDARLSKLETKFILGTKNPQDALENADNGTIYFKLGDILN